jgi:predicted ABC-type ATPase
MPTLYIISGPNGSGKTTLAKEVAQGAKDNMIIFNDELYSLFLGDTANG